MQPKQNENLCTYASVARIIGFKGAKFTLFGTKKVCALEMKTIKRKNDAQKYKTKKIVLTRSK